VNLKRVRIREFVLIKGNLRVTSCETVSLHRTGTNFIHDTPYSERLTMLVLNGMSQTVDILLTNKKNTVYLKMWN
jgi:hypothetical protein